MLKRLDLRGIGPAPRMTLEFGRRLNLLTGDNGLGKSFLLDVAWWALTRKWPAEINPRLISGQKALPRSTEAEVASGISFTFDARSKELSYEAVFDRQSQSWTGNSGRPPDPGLVLYVMSDGGFAVWDPARNYWRKRGNIDVQDRPPAYVFGAREVWDGLRSENGFLCNGLIADWAGWQKENGAAFAALQKALVALSPSEGEPLKPGELTRISLDDVRDMPTIVMPYGQEAILHASAGIRRIMALAYLLVWAWEEHQKAAKLLGVEKTSQVIFLVDEIESHLHPRWQFSIIPSLLDVMNSLTCPSMGELLEGVGGPDVQLIAVTHSPMILASVETVFSKESDAWFDLDYREDREDRNRAVTLTQREFEPLGDISNWLTSLAFDLKSAYNPKIADLLQEASALLARPGVNPEETETMRGRLVAALNPRDPFFIRWRFLAEAKGLLK